MKMVLTAGLQEVFLTPHHLAIAMEYAAGGDLSEYVQANKLPGVRFPCPTLLTIGSRIRFCCIFYAWWMAGCMLRLPCQGADCVGI